MPWTIEKVFNVFVTPFLHKYNENDNYKAKGLVTRIKQVVRWHNLRTMLTSIVTSDSRKVVVAILVIPVRKKKDDFEVRYSLYNTYSFVTISILKDLHSLKLTMFQVMLFISQIPNYKRKYFIFTFLFTSRNQWL